MLKLPEVAALTCYRLNQACHQVMAQLRAMLPWRCKSVLHRAGPRNTQASSCVWKMDLWSAPVMLFTGLTVHLCFSLFVLSYWLQRSCLLVHKSSYPQIKIIYINLWLMRGKNSPFLFAVKIPTFRAEGPEFPKLYIQTNQEVSAHEDMK